MIENARQILEQERQRIEHSKPKQNGVLIEWQNATYFGSIQYIFNRFTDVVYLSKTTNPLEDEMVKAILHIAPERPKLKADDTLDLSDRQHILRCVNSRLTIMTPEQTSFVAANPPNIVEIE